MKRLTVKGDKWGSKVEEEFVRTLEQGGIVLHPTETCYGLAVDIFNQDAVARLYQLKKMHQFKPVSVVVSGLEDARRWGDVDEGAAELMERFWPGPYTFLVNRRGALPEGEVRRDHIDGGRSGNDYRKYGDAGATDRCTEAADFYGGLGERTAVR